MAAPILQMENVNKSYGRQQVLSDITVTIPTGRVVGLIGPNGSGKSTFLKLAAGLIRPSDGLVLVSGNKACRRSAKEVAYLSDSNELYPFFTVKKLIMFYADIFDDFDIAKATEMAHSLQLSFEQEIGTLSKGSIGRLKIVLALSRNAPLILLDEPIAGFDPLVRDSIIRSFITFLDLNCQTLVLSTQEVSEVEAILDHVICIQGGRIAGCADVETVRTEQGQSLLEWMKNQLS